MSDPSPYRSENVSILSFDCQSGAAVGGLLDTAAVRYRQAPLGVPGRLVLWRQRLPSFRGRN
jgi:hypothetical protein